MLSRKEMMERLANCSDVELEGALRSIELQREIAANFKENVTQNKTRLSDIDITVIGALKADSMDDLLFEVNRMREGLAEGQKDAPGVISIKEFLVNAGDKINICNFTVDFKLNKDQIKDLNNKVGRFF